MDRIIFVFPLVATCCATERPRTVPMESVDRPESWDFNTPALDPYAGLDIQIVAEPDGAALGALIIDGHATGQAWAVAHPPRVDATGDGRMLIYGRVGPSAADMGLFVWEPARMRLSPLGNVGRQAIPPLGAVFVRTVAGEAVDAIFELSATEPRLEPIWTAPPFATLTILGVHGGGLLVLEQSAKSSDFITIDSRERSDRHSVNLDRWAPLTWSDEGGRWDGHILVARLNSGRRPAVQLPPPFVALNWELGIMEVPSGVTQSLGEVPGTWTATGMSMPAPPSARFVDEFSEASPDRPHCVTEVRVRDLAVWTWCPPERE